MDGTAFSLPDAKQKLRALIQEHVFVRSTEVRIGFSDEHPWLFDFRKLLMNGEASNLIADIFYHECKAQYPFQISSLEIAGVPLATSLMNKFYANGVKDINAFFIRKSRKKDGLFRMIEGQVQVEKKIIAVDDIINSGNSFWRQIEVLEDLGYRVDTVWAILRFRDDAYYTRFRNRGIKVYALFTLDDFTTVLGEDVHNLIRKPSLPPVMPFTPLWTFRSDDPNLGLVNQKSQPVLDEDKVYFGADNKIFWAINQSDGSVAWKYRIGSVGHRKAIFSNPALYENTIIFGGYDGNIYCLDAKDGKRKWMNVEADWIGSSPAVAHDLDMVFIGLEFGLIFKRGGIMALDARTGEPIWMDRSHTALTHSSPLYIQQYRQVIIGSNDGIARLYDAKAGSLIWKFTTFGGADYEPEKGNSGFGEGDIKESFAYDERREYIVFGSIDGFLYILDRRTGHLVHHFKCEFAIRSTPLIYKDRVYFTALDKNLRCIDLDTFSIVFEKNLDATRIFSSPTIVKDRLYVGTNAARLHEMDPNTGEETGYFQARERITNSVVYNKETDTYFLPTYANEIICLKRKSDEEVAKDAANAG